MTTLTQRVTIIAIALMLGAIDTTVAQHLASPAEAKLVVPDRKLLPGVPFDMWIEVRNPSDGTISLGLFPYFLVSHEGRESFEIEPEGMPNLLPMPSNPDFATEFLTLAPGESKILPLPIPPYSGAAVLFADPRLSPPGRYRIAIRLDAPPGHDLGRAAPPLTFAGRVTTNEVTVERIEPSGSDAKVWELMQELSKGRWAATNWSLYLLTDEILSKYPDSKYVPYTLLARGGADQESLKRLLNAINRFPDSPVIELLHLLASGGLAGGEDMETYEREWAKVQQSKRPTTRMSAFGREDLPKYTLEKNNVEP